MADKPFERAQSRLPQPAAEAFEGKVFVPLELDQFRICSWCPTPDGTGPATQVHFIIEVKHPDDKKPPMAFVLRFKGHATLDQLLHDLLEHRAYVWPGAPRLSEEL